jgi:hypothetical protein
MASAGLYWNHQVDSVALRGVLASIAGELNVTTK